MSAYFSIDAPVFQSEPLPAAGKVAGYAAVILCGLGLAVPMLRGS